MDGLADLDGVVVIGTTNSIDSIDVALRRPGCFEHEIHIGVPDLPGRAEILTIHTRRMPLAGDVQLEFACRGVSRLCGRRPGPRSACEAAYHALRRLHKEHIADLDTIPDLSPRTRDYPPGLRERAARAYGRPRCVRVVVQAPQDVSWESVGGLESVRQLLVENVVHGIRNRQAFRAAGIKPAHGVLLLPVRQERARPCSPGSLARESGRQLHRHPRSRDQVEMVRRVGGTCAPPSSPRPATSAPCVVPDRRTRRHRGYPRRGHPHRARQTRSSISC